MAVQYRQLFEIAGKPELKQRMLDMAAHFNSPEGRVVIAEWLKRAL